MKRKISLILTLVLMLSAIFSINVINVSAASWPNNISSSNYIEFRAQEKINVYKDKKCKTPGTISPEKKYDAYIAKGDDCYIYEITSSYIKVNYPTSSGRRTGYIKTEALFDEATPVEYISSAKAKVSVYKSTNGSCIAKGDKVWLVNPKKGYSGYRAVIYEAESGKRAYKMGYITLDDLDKIKGTEPKPKDDSLTSPVPNGCYFNKQTTDWGKNWFGYHDININVSTSTPVYAIADGTAVYNQSYATINGKKYLVSYGNNIEFTSKNGTYVAKYCHLSNFKNVSLTIPSNQTKQLGSSDCKKVTTITLAKRSVKKGDILGYIGTTGNSDGVHLHFELYKNSKRVDPVNIFSCLKKK